jgi:hypothetical protein
VLHRFRQVPADQKDRAAPPVLEFDADRRFVQAWGGPGEGYDWPDTEHGLFVDHQDNVWITGLNPLERSYSAPTQRTDDMVVKFTGKGSSFDSSAGAIDNGHIHIVNRKTLQVIGSIGSLGPSPGDFRGLHMLATDSKGTCGPPKPSLVRPGRAFSDSCSKACRECT